MTKWIIHQKIIFFLFTENQPTNHKLFVWGTKIKNTVRANRIEDLCAPEDETFPYKLACGVSSMEENRKIRDSALENLPHV